MFRQPNRSSRTPTYSITCSQSFRLVLVKRMQCSLKLEAMANASASCHYPQGFCPEAVQALDRLGNLPPAHHKPRPSCMWSTAIATGTGNMLGHSISTGGLSTLDHDKRSLKGSAAGCACRCVGGLAAGPIPPVIIPGVWAEPMAMP